MIAIIYGKTFTYSYALDDVYITEALPSSKSGLNGFKTIFKSTYNKSDYRPITIASFHLEQIVFGKHNPNISHLINVFIYFLICIVVILLSFQIIPEDHRDKIFLVIAIATLFALHPIHVNVVASLKNRDNLLSLFFMLLLIVVVMRMLNNGFKIHLLLLGIILLSLAYNSKRDTINFILIGPLCVFLFKNKSEFVKAIKWKYFIGITSVTLFVLLLNSALIHIFVFSPQPENLLPSYVRFTENPLAENWYLRNRISGLFSTLLLYLKLFIYPKDYLFYYGYEVFSFPFKSSLNIVSMLISLSLLGIAVFNINKNKVLAFGILFMGVNLLYCSNFITPVAGIIAARYAFMSSLGFCITLAVLLNYISLKSIRYLCLLLLGITYGYFSNERVKDWKNFETLIEADIPHLSNSHEAQRIIANAYMDKSDTIKINNDKVFYLEKALKHISKSNEIYSTNPITHVYEGITRYKLNDLENSILSFQKSIKIDTNFNELTHELLGDTYFIDNKFSLAREHYNLIYKQNNERLSILSKISSTYYEEGKMESVLSFNDSLIKANPSLYIPYENLAYYYLFKSDTTISLEYLNKAKERAINDLHLQEIITSYQSELNLN